MRHTYETLTEELVTQYANIWSYERLRKAYSKIDDQMCDLVSEIREMTYQISRQGRNRIRIKELLNEQNKKFETLNKAKKFYAIIEAELIKRETPIPGNTAQGLYGRFY